MSQGERTPAQAAFEAYYERQAGATLDMPASWNMQSDRTRDAWEAAAQAAIATAVNPSAEDYEFVGRLHEAERQRDDLRALVAEMCDVLTEYMRAVLADGGQDNDYIIQCRQRAGLEATP